MFKDIHESSESLNKLLDNSSAISAPINSCMDFLLPGDFGGNFLKPFRILGEEQLPCAGDASNSNHEGLSSLSGEGRSNRTFFLGISVVDILMYSLPTRMYSRWH